MSKMRKILAVVLAPTTPLSGRTRREKRRMKTPRLGLRQCGDLS